MKILKTLSTKPTRKVAREVLGELTLYSSKSDMYGNRYGAFSYTDYATDKTVKGSIGNAVGNADGIYRYLDGVGYGHSDRIITYNEVMPIREFNRMVKGWPYAGSQAEQMAAFIKKGISSEGEVASRASKKTKAHLEDKPLIVFSKVNSGGSFSFVIIPNSSGDQLDVRKGFAGHKQATPMQSICDEIYGPAKSWDEMQERIESYTWIQI